MRPIFILLALTVYASQAAAQSKSFDKLKWLSGTWYGTGAFVPYEGDRVQTGQLKLAYNADSLKLSVHYGKGWYSFHLDAGELGKSMDLTKDGKSLRIFIAGGEYAAQNKNFILAQAANGEILISIVYTRDEGFCLSGFLQKQ